MVSYEEALKLFGIDSGFVDQNLDTIYEKLREQNNPDLFEFLSSEYKEMSKKKFTIICAYNMLDSIFKNYIIKGSTNGVISREQLEEDIFKLLYDSIKNKKEIDEELISSLVEIIVNGLGLNSYVRRIEFQRYDKIAYASYAGKYNHLVIYVDSIRELIKKSFDSDFSPLEKEMNPYCQMLAIIRHEIEHAEQKRLREQNGNDIYTKLSVMKETLQTKRDKELDRIVEYPIIFYSGALVVRKIKLYRDYRKYCKYWRFVPTERIADIKSYNLVLNLLSRASRDCSIESPMLEEMFYDELYSTIISGYDKDPFPAITYFNKLKQYEDCLELAEISKKLSFEERLAFGLSVTREEIDFFLKDRKKVMQKIRMM